MVANRGQGSSGMGLCCSNCSQITTATAPSSSAFPSGVSPLGQQDTPGSGCHTHRDVFVFGQQQSTNHIPTNTTSAGGVAASDVSTTRHWLAPAGPEEDGLVDDLYLATAQQQGSSAASEAGGPLGGGAKVGRSSTSTPYWAALMAAPPAPPQAAGPRAASHRAVVICRSSGRSKPPPRFACSTRGAGSAQKAKTPAAPTTTTSKQQTAASAAPAPAAPAPAAPAPAAADVNDDGAAPRLLQLPFSLLQRIAQHLCCEADCDNRAALQQLSCTCSLLHEAVLATLPRLALQLQQLPDLAACRHRLSAVAVLQLCGPRPSELLARPDVLRLQESLPAAMSRLPYVRHVEIRGLRGGLLPLLQPLQALPHLQALTLQGRKGRLTLLPLLLGNARAAAKAQQAAASAAAMPAPAQQAAAAAVVPASEAPPGPSSYKASILADRSSSSDQGAPLMQAASVAAGALQLQAPAAALHDLSGLRRLTLQRLDLCSMRYSSSVVGVSGGACLCPLALLVQHLTRLESLSLQQVALDRASLASLGRGSSSSTLQELSLAGVQQRRLELHHVSVLTSLTALRLSGLKVVSGLSGGSSRGSRAPQGFGDDSDDGSDDFDDADGSGSDSEGGNDEQQQQHQQWVQDVAVQQMLLEAYAAAAAAQPQQQQQQAGLIAAAPAVPQQQQQRVPQVAASSSEERNLSIALASLTKLAVLTVSRVPALIAGSSSTGSTSGNNNGHNGSAEHLAGTAASLLGSGSHTEMLPDVLGALISLTHLAAPLQLHDRSLPGAWGHWSTSLVSLQVANLRLCSPWAPLPPLAALTELTVSGTLQAPAGFLGGFAPRLRRLSLAVLKAAEPLPPGAYSSTSTTAAARHRNTNSRRNAARGTTSNSNSRSSRLGSFSASVLGPDVGDGLLVGLAALLAENELQELVLLDCSVSTADSSGAAAAGAGGAAAGAGVQAGGPEQQQQQLAVVDEQPHAADVGAPPVAAPPAAAAAGGSAGVPATSNSTADPSSRHWAELGAKAAALDWEALAADMSGGMAAVAAAIAAVDLAGSSSSGDGGAAGSTDGSTSAGAESAMGGDDDAVGDDDAAAPAAAAAAAVPAPQAAPAAVAAGGANNNAAASANNSNSSSNSRSRAAAVPCAADVRSLMLDCRGVSVLQLERLESGCSLIKQLPRVLYYWHRLTDLRLRNVASGFNDSALLSLLNQHGSSLQHLSLVACAGITWSGVAGLKAATQLRSLQLQQLSPVTVAAVVEAVGGMSRLTSLEAEALSGSWNASKVVDNEALAAHLRVAFRLGCYWATYSASRDAGAGVKEGQPPAITSNPPFYTAPKGVVNDAFEFSVGPADEAAVRAAAPQLQHLSIRLS